MACYHPLPAWRLHDTSITLLQPKDYKLRLNLPCGTCIGCCAAKAKAWALRCHLELQRHDHACFTTLTYDDDNVPLTLQKRALQLWLKRLRKRSKTAGTLRFFASGEYGETTERPHYHAILYGLGPQHKSIIDDCWGLGYTSTYKAEPASINYVAGYVAKKIGWKEKQRPVQLDPTGTTLYRWVAPFIEMSRQPGIAAHAKQWPLSWRIYAIHNGHKMTVPRFLHKAWQATATETEMEELLWEKSQLTLTRNIDELRLLAEEKIAQAKIAERTRKRRLA